MATKAPKKPLVKVQIARLKFQLAEANQRIADLEATRSRTAMDHLDALIIRVGWNG